MDPSALLLSWSGFDPAPLFALSLFPYLAFLWFAWRSSRVPRLALIGFAMTLLFAVMTTYLSGSEVILGDVFGYGKWFPLFFGAIAVLLALNSLNNARLVQRVGAVSLVRRLALVGTCTATLLALVSFTGSAHPNFWLFTVALCLVIPIAQGLTPTCNTIAMTPMPHVAGTASALISTVTTAGGSLLGGIAASQFNGTVRPFSVFVLAFIAGAAVLILWGTAARQPT